MQFRFEHTFASISYEIIGNGFPTVHLHGYELDSTSMKYWFEPVYQTAGEFRRIYIDLPGMGESIAKPELKNAEHMLESVVACIRSILPDEQFAVAGLSYGSYLGLRLVDRFGAQIVNSLFVVPVIKAVFSTREIPEFRVAYRDEDFIRTLSPEEYDSIKGWMVIQTSTTYHRTIHEINQPSEQKQAAFLKRYCMAGYAYQDEEAFLSRGVSGNTLLVCGKEDNVVGFGDAVRFVSRCPGAELVILKNAGHNLPIEQTEKFNFIVKQWLISIATYSQLG